MNIFEKKNSELKQESNTLVGGNSLLFNWIVCVTPHNSFKKDKVN